MWSLKLDIWEATLEEVAFLVFSPVQYTSSIQDIDIAHCIPIRNTTSSPRPIVCKFTRRIAKEVMHEPKYASSIGLPADFTLENMKLFII